MREGWTRVALGEICDIQKGRHPLEKTAPGKYPLVGTAAEWRTSDTFDFAGQAVCIPMVSSTGHGHASLKRVHFVEGEFAVANIVAAAVTRDPSTVDGRYLHAYLQTHRDRLLVTLMQGTANVSLKVADLINVPVDLPPLDEQRRIVDLIGSLDAAIAAAHEAAAKAEQARRAVLTNLLTPPTVSESRGTGRSTGPDTRGGWMRAAIGDVAEVVGGGTPKTSEPSYWGGPIPWITPTEVVAAEGASVTTTSRTITELGLRKSGAQLLPKGSVLVTSRATVGAVAIAGCPMATNQGFAAMVAGPLLMPEFLMLWCQANAGEFRMRAGGSTFPEISRSVVREIPVDVPPLDEQRRIADIMSTIDDNLAALKATSTTARSARAAMLTDLLSGSHEIPSSYDRLLDVA